MSDFFSIDASDTGSSARAGTLHFQNSIRKITVETPVFMPVGTQASVKGLWQEDLEEMGYDLILANTYHLAMRPGKKLEHYGGVKPFMSWENHALLTDSGGYQAFSMSDRVKLREDSVEFYSHLDGSKHIFTPESVIDWQLLFGSDIMMVLDDCPPGNADRQRVEEALARTRSWAKRSIEYLNDLRLRGDEDMRSQKLFGIAQGGIFEDLREKSLNEIQELPFDGIAIGGLSVGESREDFARVLRSLNGKMDESRPRYLMGVGTIPDFLEAVSNGIDMFDCVLPTRNGRNGQALTSTGKINIRNAVYSKDSMPLDGDCDCRVCSRYSRGYLRHLFSSGEMLGPEMLSFHNLYFFKNFMKKMRDSIKSGSFREFHSAWKDIPF